MMDLVAVLIFLGAAAIFIVAFALHAFWALRRADAARRAAMLLRELLTPDELVQLQTDGFLAVSSGITPGRVYRIPARPGFVTVVDAGRPVLALCLQPVCSMPDCEHVLVHKLLLEGAEGEYWQRANRLRGQLWRVADASAVEVWAGPPPGVLSQR